jgi:hypothetical protein
MTDMNLFDGDDADKAVDAPGEIAIINVSKYNFRCDGSLVAPGETINASASEAEKWIDRGFASLVARSGA